MLRAGSRTFFAASLLLPAEVREPASSLYAFCRLADDAVDVEGGHLEVLARLRERLHRAYVGRPYPAAIDRALADVLARHEIPPALPEALLEGFAWDARGRRYEDLPELRAYAARVAGTVGAMMALLMGIRSQETIGRACELGVAMQLSNIARDVGEDARAGRLYLPLRWLREAGIEPEAWLARPRFTPALGLVIERLLGVADELYRRADGGIDQLPLACRPAIRAARLLYAEIGREVRHRGLDSVARRAVVPLPRKLALLARATLATALPGEAEVAPPLDEVRFLVEAAAAAPRRCVEVAPWSLEERLAWLIDLFGRLERRQQVGGSGGGA
jgi:phytoene synthase